MTREPDYSKMTQEQFDDILADLVFENAKTLLVIPGVYEAVSEYFNDSVLDRWAEDHPDETETEDEDELA